MSKFGYKLVCTDGETQGDEVILKKKQLPTVAKFLRAHEYFEAMGLMLDEGVFKSKYQVRSSWHLAEHD